MIIVIDNYDSFIYNIVQYIGEFYSDIKVFRNDKITVNEVLSMKPSGIVISPGPGRPRDAGISIELIQNCGDIPLLGVCLGHQAIAEAFGGEIISAQHIMHGKSSMIAHNQSGIFSELPTPLKGIRYHSLVANPHKIPDRLEVTATSDDREIMGLKVKGKEIYGIQFHPESFLTQSGKKIIKNFVDIVKSKELGRIFNRVKEIISKASDRIHLTENEAQDMMDFIMQGQATPSQMGAYLIALRMKGETPAEIAGSARSMFNAATKIETEVKPLIDTCGTGADKSSTFNISTAVAFVAAGAGIYVAKHGNRSVTSKSGSADVLKHLGVNYDLSLQETRECLEETRFGFMFAPLYHTAMKNVMPTRQELGVRTIFNILGPLVNPAGVKRHLMGVFSPKLLDIIAAVFVKLGHIHSFVIYGNPGLDEASIEGITYVREIRGDEIIESAIDPAEYRLNGSIANLRVSTPKESAKLITDILKGEETGDPYKAVILNSGLAIQAALDVSLEDGIRMAKESIQSGKALQVLRKVITFTNHQAII